MRTKYTNTNRSLRTRLSSSSVKRGQLGRERSKEPQVISLSDDSKESARNSVVPDSAGDEDVDDDSDDDDDDNDDDDDDGDNDDNDDDVEEDKDFEVDEKDEEDDASQSRSTVAFCRKCGARLGDFFNSFAKVTNTYYLPTLSGSYTLGGIRGPHGRKKSALVGDNSPLFGCHFQRYFCANDTCKEHLALFCKSAPSEKSAFSGRDFFKLPLIELRSEVTNKEVAPIVEETHVEHCQSGAQPQREDTTTGAEDEMEMEVSAPQRQSDLDHQVHHTRQRSRSSQIQLQQQHQHTPLQNHPSPIAPPQKAVANTRESPAVPSTQYSPSTPNISTTQLANPASVPRHRDNVVPVHAAVREHAHDNNIAQPSAHEVSLDAITRLQTQISYDTAVLHNQTRDIARLDSVVGRIQQDMRHVLDALDIMRDQISTRPSGPQTAPTGQDRMDDAALEILSNNVTSIAGKVHEIDNLKLQMELMKRRIKTLEEGGITAPAPASFTSPRPSSDHQHPPPPQQAPIHHNAPSYNTPAAAPSTTPASTTRITTPLRVESHHPPGSYHPSATASSHTYDHEPASSGWVTVNQGSSSITHGSKRGLPDAIDTRVNGSGSVIGSPKRPKLAPIEPRQIHYETPHSTVPPISYERMDTDDSMPRKHSIESYGGSSAAQSPAFIHYPSTNDMPEDDSWRPESQRHGGPVHTPYGTAKRGRPGSGGGRGRPRKSDPALELGTPEWEKPDWTGSQIGPDGYYQYQTTPGGTKRGAIIRRGSGGGGNASARAHDPSRPTPMPMDPYAHTKKTRTKPTRNADGVLIRKDGRPDMRSQSSAANLRKVHARKEQEKTSDRQHTPASGLATAPVLSGSGSPDEDDEHLHDRHHAVMNKMFPRGMEEQKARMSYREQFYPASSPIETKLHMQNEKLIEEAQHTAKETVAGAEGNGIGRDDRMEITQTTDREYQPSASETPA